MMSGILLIDDKNDELNALAGALRKELAGVQADVDTWVPQESDNPIEVFQERLKAKDIRLVVTDYDLTEQGSSASLGPLSSTGAKTEQFLWAISPVAILTFLQASRTYLNCACRSNPLNLRPGTLP